MPKTDVARFSGTYTKARIVTKTSQYRSERWPDALTDFYYSISVDV